MTRRSIKIFFGFTLFAVVSVCFNFANSVQAQDEKLGEKNSSNQRPAGIVKTGNKKLPKIPALIVDGQNNHGNWPETTMMMKKYLEQTGLFEVKVIRSKPKGVDEEFKPNFSNYKVVISNYNGAEWPADTKKAFENYMQDGGGFVVVHAADNSFPKWTAYNEMIGIGGWGGRNQKSGPYVYMNEKGETIRDNSEGNGGHHGPQHAFSLVVRDSNHPITKGMPPHWLHVKDELYDKLRGPAVNLKILATSFADPKKGGTGRHEPMLMVCEYGKGRVFHTPMGHGNYSQECVGFITCLQRGAEWAATGKVSVPIPKDFPKPNQISQRKFKFPKPKASADEKKPSDKESLETVK